MPMLPPLVRCNIPIKKHRVRGPVHKSAHTYSNSLTHTRTLPTSSRTHTRTFYFLLLLGLTRTRGVALDFLVRTQFGSLFFFLAEIFTSF